MNKKYILTNLVKNLIINQNKNMINLNTQNKNILSNYNNKWDYSNIMYNFNNNNLLSNLKYKYYIKKYINFMLNHILNDTKHNILYKEPIIIYNSNTKIYDIILFIYRPIVKVYNPSDLLITKLIKNLIESKKLVDLNINIKPILLTYEYLDSDIYSKSLSKHLSVYPKLDTIRNVKINQKILNKILLNKLNKNDIINNINSLVQSKMNINNLIFNNIFISKNIFIYTYLLHQNMIGNIWKYRGKNFNSESNARALKSWNDNKLNQSLTLMSSNNNTPFKLNYYLSSLTKSQSNFISKNGKFNVKVLLNHF